MHMQDVDPPFTGLQNEGFGWNPRTYHRNMSSWVVTVALSPGGSAWVTPAVALDDPRVSTWRLEVWSNHFNWLTASGLAILIKQ